MFGRYKKYDLGNVARHGDTVKRYLFDYSEDGYIELENSYGVYAKFRYGLWKVVALGVFFLCLLWAVA